MEPCNIAYIPESLHTNDKPVLPDFSNGEKLFRRATSAAIPFSEISLYDVSCNRSGESGKISSPNDVLWNLRQDIPVEKIVSEIATIEIKKLYPENPTTMTIFEPEDKSGDQVVSVVMSLIHDPLSCNYAHCMFVFDLDGHRVTRENYKETFNHKRYKRLRTICRDILSKAIVKQEIEF